MRHPTGTRLLVLTSVVTLTLALAGCSAASGGRTTVAATAVAPAHVVSRARPAPTSAVLSSITRLLDARAAAVRTHSRTAYLGTISGAATPSQRAAQVALFDATSHLTFARYALRVQEVSPVAGGWQVRATLSYALQGFDETPLTVSRVQTVATSARRLGVLADTSADVPWDFGPLTVVTGAHALVLAGPGAASDAGRLLALADDAVPTVSRAWGSTWSGRVVLVVPASSRQLQAEAGTGADVGRLAAVQSVELTGGRASPTTSNRIYLNPTVFLRQTSPLGQQVLLTHEVTHVASQAATSPSVPLWLVEGFADAVAFATTGLSPRQGAPELAADIALHGVAPSLPDDAAFDPGNPELVLAYEQAWLAVRLLVHRIGAAATADLYRAVGSGQSVDLALRRLAHEGLAAFTWQWRAALRAELS